VLRNQAGLFGRVALRPDRMAGPRRDGPGHVGPAAGGPCPGPGTGLGAADRNPLDPADLDAAGVIVVKRTWRFTGW
jgi:hypothetical protein